MPKNNAPKLKVGDRVTIPRYSSLFGSSCDAISDHHMAKVVFIVTGIEEAICGSDDEGWFDGLDLKDALTGQVFPYMITNASVRLAA